MWGERKLALVVLLALLLAGVAGAHADDGRPHVQADQEPRRVLANGDDGRMDVQLLLPQRTLTDVVRLRFDGEAGVLRFEHRADAAEPVPGFAVEWRIREVVEYGDQNGNHRFEPGLDLVYRTKPLKSMAWEATGNRTVQAPVPGGDGTGFAEGKSASATGRFGVNGSLSLDAYAYGGPAQMSGTTLHAQDVALHVHLEGWTYRNPESRIALVGEAWSPRDATVRTETGTDRAITGLTFHRPGAHMAFLAWDELALQDGRDRVVQATVGALGNEQDGGYVRNLVLNYAQSETLHHEMVLGLEYAPAPTPAYLGVHPWIVHGGAAVLVVYLATRLVRSEHRKHERRVDRAMLAGRTPPEPNWVVASSEAARRALRRAGERVRPSPRDP